MCMELDLVAANKPINSMNCYRLCISERQQDTIILKRMIESKLSNIGQKMFHYKYSIIKLVKEKGNEWSPCYQFMYCGPEDNQSMHDIWMKCYESKHGEWLKKQILIDMTKYPFEFKGI